MRTMRMLVVVRHLLVAWIAASTSFAEALRQHSPPPAKKEPLLFVVFGRPGAGKTTVADAALEALEASPEARGLDCVGLDLDVCVTQAMRDNFGRGIYPTLEERKVFAIDACDYVDERLAEARRSNNSNDDDDDEVGSVCCALVSFSFVNTDLRDIFRERFPGAEWILIDTTEEDCAERIREREGHFYKGEIVPTGDDENENENDDEAAGENPSSPADDDAGDDDDADNSDWKFAPVGFPHLVLDGSDPVGENTKKVVEKILNDTQPSQT